MLTKEFACNESWVALKLADLPYRDMSALAEKTSN